MTTRYVDVQITVSDGVVLSARVWHPPDNLPAPAVLECHPYRKADAAIFDGPRHRYVAEHGYVSIQLDLRGSGESGGVMADEYLPREQQDVIDVIAWARQQPWCTGEIGLYGISWGGFIALQVASLNPPGLAAIVAVCATDDRYRDDVHYIGGCVIGSDMLSWSNTMLAYNARPPDPATFGPGWRDTWHQRLEHNTPWVSTWLRHQRRDDYWRHGSVGENLDAIRCPMLLVGGWADGYRNAIVRMLRPGSTRAIVGPWAHSYPDTATPGPQIGFIDEMLRWWDHNLRHLDRGLDTVPPLRLYLQTAVRPGDAPLQRDGTWIALDAFPTASTEISPPADGGDDEDRSPLVPAVVPPTFFTLGTDPRWYLDQQAQDDQSLTFTTTPVTDDTPLVGVPTVDVQVAESSRGAVVIRLCDIWPDGTSTLVARGVLNLDHNGLDSPIAVNLSAIGLVIPAGHRLRVAVSSTSWPLVWPHPRNELSIQSVLLRLPVVYDDQLRHCPPFAAVAQTTPPEITWSALRLRQWREGLDENGTHRIELPSGWPADLRIEPNGPSYHEDGTDRFEITDGNPSSATATSSRTIRVEREGWTVTVNATSTMRADTEHFHLDASLRATLNGNDEYTRSWSDRVPRD